MAPTLDDLATRTIGRGHQECTVTYVLAQLDDATAAKFRAALGKPTTVVQHAELSAAFAEFGHSVPSFAVSRHRRGLCKCPA